MTPRRNPTVGRPSRNPFQIGRTAWLVISMLLSAPSSTVLASPQSSDLQALIGEWIYVEDQTEGRTLEQMGPPMSSKFSFGAEGETIILESGHGYGQRNVRVKLDGTFTELLDSQTNRTVRYKAAWKDSALTTETDFIRMPNAAPDGLIRREFRLVKGGLVVRVTTQSNPSGSVGLYRHPQDIAMPSPAKATIRDMAWLAGAWVGTRSSGSAIEERWSPAKGGAMLGTSRTVNPRDQMSAFEYLRIVERDGGLVYIAQPGGATPTEFVLSEVSATRAIFDNPRHDYPKRIVYELSPDGGLSATIGFMKGGSPRRFDFARERN